MQPIEFTDEQLKLYFSGKYHHPLHEEASRRAYEMRVHADGMYPVSLIDERRPHESTAVKEYREKIWKPITKPYYGKVLQALAKIRRSTEWSIKFDAEAVPPRVPQGETLEEYLMKQFPKFTSVVNWAFSLLLREYSIDANAWIALMVDETVAENQFLKPEPVIFRSGQVIDAVAGQYLVVLSDDKVTYEVGGTVHVDGDRYYIFTTAEIQRWDQIDAGRKFGMTWSYVHNIGRVPAFQMRGVVIQANDAGFLNESRMAPMLPRLDEAAREYSDLQAEVVQHIHSEKWEVGQDECAACHGEGMIQLAGFKSSKITCDSCAGTGFKPRGPYTKLIVKPQMAGEASQPTPPMGYLQKDTNIVEVQDKRIEGHIYHALAAVNMEFLMQTPVAESGIAKAYDADETNNFVHAVAEDIVAILDDVAYFTNELRYKLLVPDAAMREAMLPTIAVPERFDLFSAAMVEKELADAKNNKVNPVILNAMEIGYAQKKFSADPDVRDRLALMLELDPLPNISDDSKMMMLQNGGITKETYIVSCNIYAFIARGIDEKGDRFFDMELKDQKALMYEYAKEQADAGSMEKQIISGFSRATRASGASNRYPSSMSACSQAGFPFNAANAFLSIA